MVIHDPRHWLQSDMKGHLNFIKPTDQHSRTLDLFGAVTMELLIAGSEVQVIALQQGW
jgi:hypothetical protein